MAAKKKATKKSKSADEDTSWGEFFADLTEPLLAGDGVERGTMMGFPCLRVRGEFFASAERGTGNLIIKLPADRVDELVGAGTGESFAPNGRRFKEWVCIPSRDETQWLDLIDEARQFVDN